MASMNNYARTCYKDQWDNANESAFLKNKSEYEYKVFLDSAWEIFPTGLLLEEASRADWQ